MTAAQLKARRLQLRMSQRELAETQGVSPNTVGRWEGSVRRIGAFDAQRSATFGACSRCVLHKPPRDDNGCNHHQDSSYYGVNAAGSSSSTR
jgi:transcriptional regulator with XRE-family HTH domain